MAKQRIYLDSAGEVKGEITQKELIDNLDRRMERADWNFDYSDDYMVRRRGRSQLDDIENDLKILSFSNGGALPATQLWIRHASASTYTKPTFIDRAFTLQLEQLRKAHANPVITLIANLDQQIKDFDWNAFRSENLLSQSHRRREHIDSDLEILTKYEGMAGIAWHLWQIHTEGQQLHRPEFLRNVSEKDQLPVEVLIANGYVQPELADRLLPKLSATQENVVPQIDQPSQAMRESNKENHLTKGLGDQTNGQGHKIKRLLRL